jgi:2-phospho-L-lactate guanylyltransferase
MFEQVAKAAIAAKNVHDVHVTTPSPAVCTMARRIGVVAHLEKGRRNLNAALRRLLIRLEGKDPRTTAVIMHADLPFVTPRDVESFVKVAARRPVTVVPSKDGHGTNAIALTPPTALKPKFGPNSLQHHLRSAKRATLAAAVYHNPRIRFDVDKPQDLKFLVRRSMASPKLAARILQIVAVPGK